MRNKAVPYALVIFFTVLTGYAFAYLDAGSGSMLIQLLLGGIAGLVVFLKVSWKWILEKVGIKKADADSE